MFFCWYGQSQRSSSVKKAVVQTWGLPVMHWPGQAEQTVTGQAGTTRVRLGVCRMVKYCPLLVNIGCFGQSPALWVQPFPRYTFSEGSSGLACLPISWGYHHTGDLRAWADEESALRVRGGADIPP